MDNEQIQRLISNAIDSEFIRRGLEKGIAEDVTRRQLTEDRRMTEIYDDMMASGYTDEQIGVLWAGKMPQEIIAEADANGIDLLGQSSRQTPAPAL